MARECTICFGDEDDGTPLLELPCGDHYACPGECLARIYEEAMKNEKQFPARCCDIDIPIDVHMDAIPFDLYLKYKQKEVGEYSVHPKSRVYCGNGACAQYLHVENYETHAGGTFASCNYCFSLTCTICKLLLLKDVNLGACKELISMPLDGNAIRTENCQNEQNKRCKSCEGIILAAIAEHACEIPEDETKFKMTAKENGYQECYGCGSTVELAEACNHITCECGNEFCYICGESWNGAHECPLYGVPEYDEDGYNQDGFHKETGLNRVGRTRRQELHPNDSDDEGSDEEDILGEDDLVGIDPEFRDILANLEPEERLEAIEQMRILAIERGEVVFQNEESHEDDENNDEDEEAEVLDDTNVDGDGDDDVGQGDTADGNHLDENVPDTDGTGENTQIIPPIDGSIDTSTGDDVTHHHVVVEAGPTVTIPADHSVTFSASKNPAMNASSTVSSDKMVEQV